MADESKGLADIVAASTALSDIDGQVGKLVYRGYDIHDIAERISFEECVYLLQSGDLPNRQQLDELREELTEARTLGAIVEDNIEEVARAAAPMEALRTLVSLGSAGDPDKGAGDAKAEHRKAVRLVAQQPVLVAKYHAARRGETAQDADPELGIAGNFLLQITGRRPEQREIEIFDSCLVMHADHTMNASTFTARVIAATLSDMHSAIVGAIGALKGPLHGGANEAVMANLDKIGSVDKVEEWTNAELGAGNKISGFGHRVYKVEDPRATHLRSMSEELAGIHGDDRYYRMSKRMEEVVLETKGLYPNVDFFAASVYHYLGIPTDLFTSVFSVSRMAGWTAHVLEQHADNRLIRPESEYIGEHDRKFVPLGDR
ncbi:MAG: citrate synthase [Streptosporangiales bacterium]|nr:citrate synthase [Streptosporangiales bacterium]